MTQISIVLLASEIELFNICWKCDTLYVKFFVLLHNSLSCLELIFSFDSYVLWAGRILFLNQTWRLSKDVFYITPALIQGNLDGWSDSNILLVPFCLAVSEGLWSEGLWLEGCRLNHTVTGCKGAESFVGYFASMSFFLPAVPRF